MITPLALMSTSLAEATLLLTLTVLLLGWSLWRFRVARWIATAVVAVNLCMAIANADDIAAPADDAVAADDAENSNDGDRDWGRDDGIAVGLSTTSKVVIGVAFLGILGVVGWMVAYRKPDGTVHPYDDASADP